MRAVHIDGPPPAGVSRRHRARALALAALLLAVAAFVAGSARPAPPPDPIESRGGVPVGVDHTPAGAVVAADDYVATEQATVERDPERFAALVSEDYVPRLKATALTGARADRAADPGGVRLWAKGGQSLTTIGAHRLDRYSGGTAQVTLWVGQILWGTGRPPCQVWGLTRVTIVWQDERWS